MGATSRNQSYLFFDLETTGLNPCFDQILQFAAIRTDLELREIERYQINVKLNRDVIPSPSAMITHRISIENMLTGSNELEAIQQIHYLFNTPGTISIGYNNLGFDDEFLRFAFYRNLLTPYTHQYANQCSRMDLYPITVMFYLYNSDICQWPKLNDQISLKLEYLCQANQLATGQAHTALVDVKATLELAKRFLQQREMWDYLIGYFDKETDSMRIRQLKEALLIDGKLGAINNYLAPVLHLGTHAHYKNQTLWLRLDLDKLTQTTHDNIFENTFVIHKKMGENGLLLPMKERFLSKLDKTRQQLFQKHKQWLSQNPQLLTDICERHRNYQYPKIDNIDPDAALYEIGFSNREEELLFQKFHQANIKDKPTIINQFTNTIRKQQGKRILYRHYPNDLPKDDYIDYQNYLNTAIIQDFRGQIKLTRQQALIEIDKLITEKNLDQNQQSLLNELKDFLSGN